MTIPLSLYIHIPWCIKKCPYCDFNSHQAGSDLPEMQYIECLINDLEQELPSIWGRNIQTIFIGGGTPSLFSPDALDYLFQQIHARIPYSPHIEITMEANPGTVEQHKFQEFRKMGINRLSLGIQSFQDEKLQRLGRIHTGTEAHNAINTAKEAGFDNFNLDIMFGLPGQSLEDALHDVKNALTHQPTHFSWYQLTIEPNTHYFQFPPKLPDDDYIWEMQEQGQALLNAAGLHQYEISAYSPDHLQCQHNRNYWLFGDYLGIGAGAHSKITDSALGVVKRKWKIKHPKQYLAAKEFTAGEKIVSSSELPLDFMLNALRLHEPIACALFEERTLLAVDSIQQQLHAAEKLGLITCGVDYFSTTSQGKLFLNDLLQIFSSPDATK
ncbi:MAG: radical SAM family heme chaperone HemW [Gammaproteobacteria bacterium]|nr:radical SAM family heme chaperone HemW [Gammaproteobacteria bacterium]